MGEMNGVRMQKEDQTVVWWRYRYLIAAILFIAYSIQYLDRIKTTALIPLIKSSINLNYADIGNGIFLMMVFYGPAQFVSGMLCDKYGQRKYYSFRLLSWIAMTVWMRICRVLSNGMLRSAIFGLTVGTEFVPSARLLAKVVPTETEGSGTEHVVLGMDTYSAWAAIVATQLATFFLEIGVLCFSLWPQ